MVLGPEKDDIEAQQLDHESGEGQAVGVEAQGTVEGNAYSPLGGAGMRHWRASYVDRPGFHERGNIFFAAVEMTRMPMTVTDPRQPDNPIVFANNAFIDLTGYERSEVEGRNCRFLQGADTDRDTVAELAKAVHEQRAIAVDILNYKKDGTPFWNALFIGPVFDQSGELLYFFASQMDITQRRVSQQSTLQAQKMEAIGQLTAGLAHDFNNLLQVVNGNLELAQRMLDGKHPAGEALQRAEKAALKGAKLTQQLLTFARKQRLEPKRLNLNTVVVEFSEMLVRTLGSKVDLHLDLKPGLPACTLDPTHLEMALLNVLINARDAMPEGGQVSVGTTVMSDAERLQRHQLPPGTYVVICVIDQGTGMTPEVARRAIEPFFTTKGPGTGLGLAMVHGFVQQSRGRLEIESAPGAGTTVRLIFPATGSVADARPAAVVHPRQREGLPVILLVEDNEDVRQLAHDFLAASQYEVVPAASAEEALQKLAGRERVDLVFSDVIMPGGMNGVQLADRLRQSHPDLPVLLTTGYMEELAGKAPAGEPLDILPKPYKHHDLLERIAAAIARKAPERRRQA
ncbi:PAS domain-containing protein [Massilia arenosa]|uniref:histidine kinase n=1 Tax=Zemynaea arenosa TaxID=2561931 RepID=A0A4Y9RRS8_9BURK|nr:histidine kinase famiy protein [Massilia arenosa]TFW10665.1 PAS domain-containing protein [Massilia arenosa]